MTTESKEPAAASSNSRERWLRAETGLAIAGALAVGGFFLSWFPAAGESLSGLELTGRGGAWMGLFAIPALGLITAGLGALGWRASRYAGLAMVLAVLAPAVVTLAAHWPWLHTIGVVAGLVVAALGVLKRGLRATPLIGVALLGAVALAVWLVGGDPVLPDASGSRLLGLLIPAAIPLVILLATAGLAAVGLIVTGLRKKGRERALIIGGVATIGLSAYVAALDELSGALATSGFGAWLTGAAVLLIVALVLTTRARQRKPKATAVAKVKKRSKRDAEPDKKPAEASAENETVSPAKKAAVPAKTAKKAGKIEDAESAEKAAKIEKLKKLKKLKLLKAKELAATKEAKAAEKDDEATAKAGEALANEPEPVFASDPTAPPPPEDEDRDALMARVGVKKPPPPSDSELEAMLAALKSRTDDD